MKQKMILVTLLCFLGLIGTGAAYGVTQHPGLFSAAITFGTAFYHLAMRLMVGCGIDAIWHNHMDPTKWWFRERPFERGLYRALRVRAWKGRLPTFDPAAFAWDARTPGEIAGATCQSEVVHEVNMVLSFLPVVFSVWFGSLGVFLITSFAAFLFDSVFVILQRYNRPRLMRVMERAQRRKGENNGNTHH